MLLLELGLVEGRPAESWVLQQPIAQRVNGLVFPDDFGNVQNNNNWRRLGFYPACKKAGIDRLKTKKPIVWHDLRHYYASTLLFDLKPGEALVAKYMGHHSATFTADTYGHWLEDDKQEEAMCDEMSIIHEKVIGLGRAGQ